jgi:hypothetical protein
MKIIYFWSSIISTDELDINIEAAHENVITGQISSRYGAIMSPT